MFFWNTLWAQINKEVVITKVQIYVKTLHQQEQAILKKSYVKGKLKETEMDEIWVQLGQSEELINRLELEILLKRKINNYFNLTRFNHTLSSA